MSGVIGSVRLMGVLSIILGIIAMATPMLVGTSVLYFIGFTVIAGGILRMIWALKATSLGSGIMKFLLGVLTLLAGIAVVSHPVMASGVLAILLAVFFILDGIAEIVAALGLPSGSGKGLLLFNGVVSLVLGGMIYAQFPLSGALAIGILLGIKLLFSGLLMLTLGTAAKRALS